MTRGFLVLAHKQVRPGYKSLMSYRDDLDAAHARIEALEAELARFETECKQLRTQVAQLGAAGHHVDL